MADWTLVADMLPAGVSVVVAAVWSPVFVPDTFVAVRFPASSISTDEDWMIPDDLFARLYGLGFGLGRSSPVGRAWQEKIRKQIISSPGITSGASFVKKMQKQRKFWLAVNTELIVYGATEPDAKVLVQGKPIPLRPDGTFSLRFALPDGKQRIPVEGTSRDGIDKITTVPIVTKETR